MNKNNNLNQDNQEKENLNKEKTKKNFKILKIFKFWKRINWSNFFKDLFFVWCAYTFIIIFAINYAIIFALFHLQNELNNNLIKAIFIFNSIINLYLFLSIIPFLFLKIKFSNKKELNKKND